MLRLYYLSDNTTGGWTTFTAHLAYGLRALKVPFRICRIRPNHEGNKPRDFGYGLDYYNYDLRRALLYTKKDGPAVIMALQKNFATEARALLATGASIVIHDPSEFTHTDLEEYGPTNQIITIRRAVQKQIPYSFLLPHPYMRSFKSRTRPTHRHRACSIARIDFDKHTTILLDANRLLPKELQIQIRGFENRLYTKFKVCPEYPEWEQSVAAYPRGKDEAVKICNAATFSCDMSLIKGDGGGTQYTFLEAMDAGSVNVIHRGWMLLDEMDVAAREMIPYPEPWCNCMAVGNGQELADLLANEAITPATLEPLIQRGEALLKKHDAALVARMFLDHLKRRDT